MSSHHFLLHMRQQTMMTGKLNVLDNEHLKGQCVGFGGSEW